MPISKEENELKPMLVGELLKQNLDTGRPVYNFRIPAYQRGFRWEDEQVVDLLDDIFEFITVNTSTKQKYCIQPIVVKQLPTGEYEVLDGQQRLTTIFILLSRLKKTNSEINLFSLDYDTRPKSAEYLANLDGSVDDGNPDFYYIGKAYQTINQWLIKTAQERANISSKIFNTLVESIEFIWYKIDNNADPIDVFTRINIGKIPLTNAELVKAVFLSQNNLSLGFASADIEQKSFKQILSLTQNAIALEWDEMEKTLQDKKLWSFLGNEDNKYETRIDYLLDLESGKPPGELNQYYSFKHFYNAVKEIRLDAPRLREYAQNNKTVIGEQWSKLKMNFDILYEWFQNRDYNHFVGFLIQSKTNVVELIDSFKHNDKEGFKKLLFKKINQIAGCNELAVLKYGEQNYKIGKLLLFHNIYNNWLADDNISFPYEKINSKDWTLEHIFAQNSDELREEDYVQWLTDHREYFSMQIEENKETANLLDEINKLLIRKDKKIDKDDFQACFFNISAFIQAQVEAIDNEDVSEIINAENHQESQNEPANFDWINDDDSIANLALLDGSANSAIKNALFEIKRQRILTMDKTGKFIPGETKKVFLKYYTTKPKHLAYWTFGDRKCYIESITTTLTFLNQQRHD